MSPKSFLLTERIHDYLLRHSGPLDDVQRRLIAETAALGGVSGMQVAPEQGAFMTLLTALMGARHAVEVGTFTGYSALCIARGLGPDGRLVCCDISEEWTAIARRHWAEAGVADRIDLRIGPAAETLAAIPADPPVDLVFIDADKGGYPVYWEQALRLLRPGGAVLVDNVLWAGRAVEGPAEGDTAAIRAFNDAVAADPRVEVVMLPIADGLTLARKR
jgi:caffeoyl-CoA O-methyltransferase